MFFSATIIRKTKQLFCQSQSRVVLIVALACSFVSQSQIVHGQGSGLGGFRTLGGQEPAGQYPSPQYYLALELYRGGDLATASDAFEEALRQARVDIRGRWIDSIPVLAMMAECQWQLGNLVSVRQYVDQAMQIAIFHQGWLSRIDWSSAVQANLQRPVSASLWPQARAVRVAPISDQVILESGEPLTENAIRRGGIIEEPNLRSMDLVEIMRGLALVSHRRRILMGPLCDQDELTGILLEATRYPENLTAPIGQTLISALRVAEYSSYFEDRRVREIGPTSALHGGGVHPLTPLVLLSQISAMVDAGQSETVLSLALQTVHFSAAIGQVEFIGEALQLAAGCCSSQQAIQVRQVAEVVSQSMMRSSHLAALHSLIAGADAAITGGDLETADRLLGQVKILMGRRNFLQPRLKAYASYVGARFAAASGVSMGMHQTSALDQSLEGVIDFALDHRFRTRTLISMPYLYQRGLVQQAAAQRLGANTSERLLKQYSDDPGIEVWRRDPVDAIAGLLADRSSLQLARLNLAASGGYAQSFLSTWNETVSSRFMRRLPLHGRLLQVRSLAGLADDELTPEILALRQKLGPKMARLTAKAQGVDELDVTQADAMEAKASLIALERVVIPRVMPPSLNDKEPTITLPSRTAMITFTELGNEWIGTLSTKDQVRMWSAGTVARSTRDISKLLLAIGVGKTRGKRLPEDESWREIAEVLRDQLFPPEAKLHLKSFDHLVLVPDGSLWYLPFELLPIPEHATDLFSDRVQIRYAPTPGFALRLPTESKKPALPIGISSDLFFAPRDLDKNEAAAESLIATVPGSLRLPDDLELPGSFLGKRVDHLMVARPQVVNPKMLLAISPVGYDQQLPIGTLASWIRFPVDAPKSIVLAGVRSPVDLGQMGSGDELFAYLCALHVSGVQSVLISRWAVGGESTALLLRKIAETLPSKNLNEAWVTGLRTLQAANLAAESEPLLTKAELGLKGLTGRQPLFWSGYLLSGPPSLKAPLP